MWNNNEVTIGCFSKACVGQCNLCIKRNKACVKMICNCLHHHCHKHTSCCHINTTGCVTAAMTGSPCCQQIFPVLPVNGENESCKPLAGSIKILSQTSQNLALNSWKNHHSTTQICQHCQLPSFTVQSTFKHSSSLAW